MGSPDKAIQPSADRLRALADALDAEGQPDLADATRRAAADLDAKASSPKATPAERGRDRVRP